MALKLTSAPDDAVMTLTDDVDFSGLSQSDLAGMLRAGEQVLLCQRVLDKTVDDVVGAVLKDQGIFHPCNKYPNGGVSDTETASHYYYHAHPAEERPGEHGHFHTFLIQSTNVQSTSHAVPGSVPPCEAAALALSHIVAIGMDGKGCATKLFCTNRWVTGEAWCESGALSRMLRQFDIGHTLPSLAANLWVTNMLALYRRHIELLLHARDKVIANWQEKYPGDDVFEDRRLGVTVEMSIDVKHQVAAIQKALAARGGAANSRASNSAVARLQGENQSLRKQLVAQKSASKLLRSEIEAERQSSKAELRKEYERQVQLLCDAFEAKLNEATEHAERRVAEEIEPRLADSRAQWEAEVEEKLHAMQQANEAALTCARETSAAEARELSRNDKESLLSEAAEEWAREEKERLAAAKAQWAIHLQAMLAQRDHRWQAKLDRQLHDAQLAIRTEEARAAQIRTSRAAAGEELQPPDLEPKRNRILVRTLSIASLFALIAIGALYIFPGTEPVVDVRIQALMAEIGAGANRLIGLEGPTVAKSANISPAANAIFIRSNVANLRIRPSLQAKIVGTLSRGTKVERLERQGGWVRIRVADAVGTTAWVHASLLSDNRVQ